MKRKAFGFTLIELLIVVAIIAILAAIAVPNFLEAQVRAKVSRAKGDIHSLVVGIESYSVDHSKYPFGGRQSLPEMPGASGGGRLNVIGRVMGLCITTPIAYLTSIPEDSPFGMDNSVYKIGFQYLYMENASFAAIYNNGVPYDIPWYDDYTLSGAVVQPVLTKVKTNVKFWLCSKGPDRDLYDANTMAYEYQQMAHLLAYDPTNGTVSSGNIVHVGP